MPSSLFFAINVLLQKRLRYLLSSRRYMPRHNNARVWKGQEYELIADSCFILSLIRIVSDAIVIETS